MEEPEYDLVVVGAGIHGAGVAARAAAHGWRTLVLERTGVAAGTSSRSSKLIHGGLRYLESAQLGLVRECLHERAALLQAQPDLVHLTPHLIPVYGHSRRGPMKIRLGLSLYALLGGLGPAVRFRRVPRREWAQLDGLKLDGLRALYRYYDAQTDDAALTRRILDQAQTDGAELALPATLVQAQCHRDGLDVEYETRTGRQRVCSSCLVNAAGPWVNAVATRIAGGHDPLPMATVAGTHLVFDRPLRQGVYYVESPVDGRAVFVMPWQGEKTLVGTTERVWHGDPGGIEPSPEEVDYLLQTLRTHFPAYRDCNPSAAFAGLRVLPQAAGSPSRRSRETRLVTGCSGRVVSIYGGKLTAFAATARRVLAQWGVRG